MSLIGLRCKHSDVFSLQVLIGRGLFLLLQVHCSPSYAYYFSLFFSVFESVLMAVRSHPFPFRTRKLSSLTLMILGWRRPGKLNQCRYKVKSLSWIETFLLFCWDLSPTKLQPKKAVFLCPKMAKNDEILGNNRAYYWHIMRGVV